MQNILRIITLSVLAAYLVGCAEDEKPMQSTVVAPVEAVQAAPEQPLAQPELPEIPSISLGGSNPGSQNSTTVDISSQQSSKERRESLLAAMKPLQVMLGAWRGTIQKVFGDFKAVDQPEWIWDFQTDRAQPAMVMTSKESPYFKSARLTYLTDKKIYQLTTTDPEGSTRTYQGDFSKAVEEIEGDDQKLHVTYKLKLAQIDATSARDQWEVIFNQQDSHRYLVELYKGSNHLRFDTVATQRAGTSFAKSDSDYGDKECIISGGLGTIQVSFNGKNYWVCCTGCQAAFNEDPKTWIAEYEEKQAKKAASK